MRQSAPSFWRMYVFAGEKDAKGGESKGQEAGISLWGLEGMVLLIAKRSTEDAPALSHRPGV